MANIKRIAFVGVHNGGKDTLTTHAFSYLKMHKKTCKLITECAEEAISRSIDLSKPVGAYWLLGAQIVQEMQAVNFGKREYVICNRGVIDSIPYAQQYLDYGTAIRIENMVKSYLAAWPYYAVIWLRPLPTIEDDGVRMTDQTAQRQLDEKFKTILSKYVDSSTLFIVDDKTKAERIHTVETILDFVIAKSDYK